jgi:hypothetical protein
MYRAALFVCTALVVLACDSTAAEEARATGMKLAAKDKEIAELRAQLAAAGAPAAPAPTPEAAPLGPGRLDPLLVRIAASARKMKLELEVDGSVRKLAVYHDEVGAVPAAVIARASEVFPGAKVRSYESEYYRDLGRVFEVEVETAGGQRCEVSAREDGALVYKECELDVKAMPPEIVAALERDAPGRKLLEVERKDHADGKVEFVAELGPVASAAKKPAPKQLVAGDEAAGEELYYDAAGKLLRREVTLSAEVEIARP